MKPRILNKSTLTIYLETVCFKMVLDKTRFKKKKEKMYRLYTKMNVLNLFYQSSGNRVYDRWTQSHLPFEYHSYGSNQQGGFCPKGILSILWRGFCPPCKNHEGDYVHPVKSFKGDYVHLVKNMKGISSTYAKMSRGDFVRGGFCPTLRSFASIRICMGPIHLYGKNVDSLK